MFEMTMYGLWKYILYTIYTVYIHIYIQNYIYIYIHITMVYGRCIEIVHGGEIDQGIVSQGHQHVLRK